MLFKLIKTFINFVRNPGLTGNYFISLLPLPKKLNSLLTKISFSFDEIYNKTLGLILIPLLNSILKTAKPNEILIENGKWFIISWVVSDHCNYKCSYCQEKFWQGHFKNNEIDGKKENIIKILEHIKSQNLDKLYLMFTGGEPSLWAPLKEISEFIKAEAKQRGIYVCLGINSNLAMPTKWWDENKNLFDLVIASFHPEFTKREDFIEKCKALESDVQLTIRMMMKPGEFDYSKESSNQMFKNLTKFNIEYVPLLTELGENAVLIKYKKEEDQFLKNHSKTIVRSSKFGLSKGISSLLKSGPFIVEQFSPTELLHKDLLNFKNWQCDIHHQLTINYNNEVHHGSCMMVSKVGDINKAGLELRKMPVICEKTLCHCGSDQIIPKRKYPKSMDSFSQSAK